MKKTLAMLVVLMLTAVAFAQTKTLTIDFSKGNEWDQPFIYNSDPVKGKTYNLKDGWKIKFSNGALMYKDYPENISGSGLSRFKSHPGPLIYQADVMVHCLLFWFSQTRKGTGVDIFNENGLQATAVRYYYDYIGMEPKLTAKNGNQTVGYSKTETKQYTYRNSYNYGVYGEDDVVNCILNEPAKTISFGGGGLKVQNKEFSSPNSIVNQAYDYDWDLNRIPDNDCYAAKLYKIEIDYEPAKYASSYAELLAQYKELEGKYGAAEGEIADLKSSLEVEYANNDALDAKVKQLQEDLEKEEEELGETLNDLTSAQMAARRYMALYNLNKRDLDKMNSVYPAGVPSMFGNPSKSLFSKNILSNNETLGANKELGIQNTISTHNGTGIKLDNDGKYYIGTKQGYYITRVDVEYLKIDEADNTVIVGDAQYTKEQENMWRKNAKAHHATYIANDEMNNNTNSPRVKVRGVNITAAPGETIIITDIKVWTAESNDRWNVEDYSMGTDNFYTYDDFVKYGGSTSVKAINGTFEEDSNAYDLSGRPVDEKNFHGVIVKNGVKMMLK